VRGRIIGENLEGMAKLVFVARDKNPYYLGDKPIKNLEELKQNLDSFSEREADWVAAWIEYLGDSKTAQKIRTSKGNFKKVIMDRYNQLKIYK